MRGEYIMSQIKLNNKEKKKELVLEAFDTLFNQRDYIAAEHYWSPKYIQHSAHIPPAHEGLYKYQVSEKDHAIPPDVERMFGKQMNATIISLPSSHVSYISRPTETARLILDAASRKVAASDKLNTFPGEGHYD